ncbi:TonB family protein [Desulfovibrio litoralis]|uniref:TonB family C-terminal domain-containing protein n=1 Tax=Desulfovibrio litoralis DSM 11393 TaxID=1121455 RepID=A0A1M7RW77_9BACT|nr:TonB family protein [Desulfovibrio litoralis]SHN50414.1 TonB family C-terminal domain-containing protein [Desulfovibrio litoralis DSM 11393]
MRIQLIEKERFSSMLKNISFIIVLLFFLGGGYQRALTQTALTQNQSVHNGNNTGSYDWSSSKEVQWDNEVQAKLKIMNEFKEKVRKELLAYCTYPPLGENQEDASVELIVGLDEKGVITELDINRSSGRKQFDAAFMLAAKRIPVFLPPPENKPVRLFLEFKQSELLAK